MKHEEAAVRLVDLEEGRLEGTERERILAHTASCAACQAWIDGYRELVAALRPTRQAVAQENEAGTRTGEHPSSDLLARFVTAPNTLDDAAWWEIERHIEGCGPCADDATRLASVLEGDPGQNVEPTTTPAGEALPAAAPGAAMHPSRPRARSWSRWTTSCARCWRRSSTWASCTSRASPGRARRPCWSTWSPTRR